MRSAWPPAAPRLPAGRTADPIVGQTLVEIKTGWLEYLDDRHRIVDQLLGYALLSQLTDNPVTHVAGYLARYQSLFK